MSTASRAGPAPGGAAHADRAYALLLEAIATCELAPGSVFNEREQAAALGMSRTPLRQALHRLALEGLVETVPQRGVFVSLLDPKVIHDNTVVREVLEVDMLRRVVVEERPVDLAALTELLEQMDTSIAAVDPAGYLRADQEFHVLLAAAAGNAPALAAIHRSWIHVNRLRYLEHEEPPGLSASLREHRAMLAAVRGKDPARLENAVRAHMRRSRARLTELATAIPHYFVPSSEDRTAAPET